MDGKDGKYIIGKEAIFLILEQFINPARLYSLMKAIKASILYDGKGKETKSNQYIVFDKNIQAITQSKPSCELIGEGIVTPAFIDGHCHIGMARSGEPEAEEETNEEMETIFPLMDAIDSIYMDDHSFRESVEWGVLYSHVMPGSGNILAGKTVLIRNYAEDIEDALIKHIGIKAALGYNPRSTAGWKGKRPTTRMGALALLRDEFIKAIKEKKLVEKRKKKIEEVEPLEEEIINILDNKIPLMVHVHKADDLMILRQLIREFGIKAVANHCVDVNSLAIWEKLKQMDIPVIYGPLDAFPYKVELKHMSWRNAEQLVRARPKFGLMSDHPVIQQRSLPLQLRYFRRFGMSKAEAIGLITKENADIIGAQEMGSIEKGKWASMVVWNRDPFSLDSYPIQVIGEGKVVYEEK